MSEHPSWPIRRLADVVAGITVGHVGPMTAEYRDVGVPFLRSQNVRRLRIDTTGLRYINQAFHERLSKSRLRSGDVVVVRTGEPGTAAAIPEWLGEANCADLVIIRPGAVNPRFLAYFINSVVSGQIAGLVVGAVQQHFNIGAARDLPIPLPPRKDQDAIAQLLGALDDRVELNSRIGDTLRDLSSCLFKSWFVDFDPVVARRNGGNSSLPTKEAAEAFPEHFDESALGPIPRGWGIAALSEVASFTRGRSYTSDELRPSRTALVTLKSFLRGGGYRPDGLKEYVGDYKLEQVIVPRELVVAATDVTQAAEVVGRAARVLASPQHEVLVASLDVVIVRPHGPSTPVSWLAELLGTDDYVSHAVGHANGTTVLHLANEALPTYRFARPPQAVMAAFDSIAEPLNDRRMAVEAENLVLGQLRDTLMAALFSGEISVKGAEAVVSEVA